MKKSLLQRCQEAFCEFIVDENAVGPLGAKRGAVYHDVSASQAKTASSKSRNADFVCLAFFQEQSVPAKTTLSPTFDRDEGDGRWIKHELLHHLNASFSLFCSLCPRFLKFITACVLMIGGSARSLGEIQSGWLHFFFFFLKCDFLDTFLLNERRGRGQCPLRLSPISPRLKRIQQDAVCCHRDGLHQEPSVLRHNCNGIRISHSGGVRWGTLITDSQVEGPDQWLPSVHCRLISFRACRYI